MCSSDLWRLRSESGGAFARNQVAPSVGIRKRFLQRLDAALAGGTPFDAVASEKELCAWEAGWTRGTESYPDRPVGDTLAVARRLWEKYRTAAMSTEGLPPSVVPATGGEN